MKKYLDLILLDLYRNPRWFGRHDIEKILGNKVTDFSNATPDAIIEKLKRDGYIVEGINNRSNFYVLSAEGFIFCKNAWGIAKSSPYKTQSWKNGIQIVYTVTKTVLAAGLAIATIWMSYRSITLQREANELQKKEKATVSKPIPSIKKDSTVKSLPVKK
jgi:hypothetical protein